MLALAVEYLSGQVYAADFRDRNQAEWPPHPARLFSALAATCYEADLGWEALDALRWLECQGTPALHHGAAHPRATPVAYVPVNDDTGAKVLPERRTRQPRTFPCAVPDEPKVYFLWPDAEPSVAQRALLAMIAARVTYLGSSRSLVQVSLCEQPPAPTLIPDETGECVLRVAGAGRLAELDELFALGRRPTSGLLQPYRRSTEPDTPAVTVTPSLFGDFLAFRRTAGPALPLEAALALSNAARNAVLGLAGDAAPAVLHGHGQQPHVAWAPLSFVDHEYADGRLLGLAVLLPEAITPADRRLVLRALGQLRRIGLPGGRLWEVEPAGPDAPRTLWRRTWTRPARIWTTVTPMILDRFPDDRRASRSLAAIIAKACRDVGCPNPESVSASRAGMLRGVPPSSRFPVRRQAGEPRRPYTHVTLRFAQPVAGPLLLGAGRYFGLGLFRPTTDFARFGERSDERG